MGDIVEGQFDDAEEDTPSLGLAQSAQNEKPKVCTPGCTQSHELVKHGKKNRHSVETLLLSVLFDSCS